LSDEHRRLRATFREGSKADSSRHAATVEKLAEFARQASPQLDVPLPVAGLQDGATPVPDGGDFIKYLQWCCPAKAMCEHGLWTSAAAKPLKTVLRQEWEKLHEPLTKTHNFTAVKYATVTRCSRAGFCLHTPAGQLLDRFVTEFERAMRLAVSPGEVPRAAYDMNALLIRLQVRPRRGIRGTTSEHFFHVGHGNLSSASFELMKLTVVSDGWHSRLAANMGLVALAANPSDPECGAANAWRSFLPLELTKPILLSFYRIASSSYVLHAFSPKDLFAAALKMDNQEIELWVGKPAAAAPLLGMDGTSGSSLSSDSSDSDAGDAPPPGLDDEEAPSDDDGGDVDDALVRALAALMDEDDWTEPESDSGDDGVVVQPAADAVPAQAPAPVPAPAPAPLPPPLIPAPPAALAVVPVPPLPLPPPVGRGRGRGGGGGGGRAPGRGWRVGPGGRVPYVRYAFGNGYFILRPDAPGGPSIDAHCDMCEGKLDRKSREHPFHARGPKWKTQGRPVGLQLLWLSFDCGGVKDRHSDLLKVWFMEPGMKYEDRHMTRAYVGTHRLDLAPVFEMERHPWDDEVLGEPFFLCGVR
jgi:hypothetical protein